jgi:hypothetical protein
VEANNDATLAELCDLLLQQTNIRVEVSTMFRMLKKQQLTVKKTLHPNEKETERVQNHLSIPTLHLRATPVSSLSQLEGCIWSCDRYPHNNS